MQKYHKHYGRRFNTWQRGFTMVEILVAMAIGLFLLAGVFQLFIANKQSSLIQNNLSHIQENGRFAISQLGRAIRKAGFKADSTDSVTFATVGATTGTNGTGPDGSDQIFISFQAADDGTTVDCLGKTFPAAVPPIMITNGFYLAADANGVRNLYCSRTAVPADSDAQPLVENVTDMQITYGLDVDNTGSANYYVDASAVNAADWSKVVSIRVTLLLVSREDNIATTAQTYRYDGVTVTASDNHLYKVFSITIALRNSLV